MDVRLPRHEPVGRERQHPLRRRHALQFLVQLDQAVARQPRLRLQQLQPGAQFDEFDREVISFTSFTTLLLAMVNNRTLDVVRMCRRRRPPARRAGANVEAVVISGR
jgi:hypothetical protein